MRDYRAPEHRAEYFEKLYAMNLRHGVMPGLVYLYLPVLAEERRWDAEQQLWFAAINGCTQNPITSLRIFERAPEPPRMPAGWRELDDWFNSEWATLQFDTDRLKNKRNTLRALYSYAKLAREAGSQVALYAGKSYADCWAVASSIFSFGRLSAFSYLEYVHLLGYGPDCTDLMFGDKAGSRSHRNGMMLLHGLDHQVWDKRMPNGFGGEYDMARVVPWLNARAEEFLRGFRTKHPELDDAGNFTLESNLCTFKNHFFSRRYPGVYADMAWDRIAWYDERGLSAYTAPFKAMRQLLPDWLRIETQTHAPEQKARAAMFPETGVPFRAEHFL